ncbi:MAG: hypothetical protein GY788_28035 [bacterium]|nr:hypothetical protein [bacterium]
MTVPTPSVHACIDDAQLTARSKLLLRAYTAEYRAGKRYAAAARAGALLLAFAGPLAALHSLEWASVVAAAAGGWIFLARLYLYPARNRHVHLAARIQEEFDTELFDISWGSGLAGSEPAEEDIVAAARRVETDDRLTSSIDSGWYATTSGIRWPMDVLFCQLASVTWGRRQHATYARWLVAFVGILVAVAGTIGLVRDLALSSWLVTFLFPSLPALLEASELAIAQRQQSERKEGLEQDIRALWDTEIAELGTLSDSDCRAIQDEAFRLRDSGLQVPEILYWRSREKDEANMRQANDLRRVEYLAAIAGAGGASP